MDIFDVASYIGCDCDGISVNVCVWGVWIIVAIDKKC
jgi:hypothetical protein